MWSPASQLPALPIWMQSSDNYLTIWQWKMSPGGNSAVQCESKLCPGHFHPKNTSLKHHHHQVSSKHGFLKKKKTPWQGRFHWKDTLAREATTWPGVARSGSTLTITMFVSTWRGVNLDEQIVQDSNTKIVMFQSAWDLETELAFTPSPHPL